MMSYHLKTCVFAPSDFSVISDVNVISDRNDGRNYEKNTESLKELNYPLKQTW